MIEVLRIGQRLVRDDRVTTHAALVSRAFGARRIFMNEVNPEIGDTLSKLNESMGGDFEVVFIDGWLRFLRGYRGRSKIVHLTMYGECIGDVQERIRQEEDILVVVGAGKVPREVYDLADYNVAVGNQPHSEIGALAVLLDRIQEGRQFDMGFPGAKMRIVPEGRGKNVVDTGGPRESGGRSA